MLTFYRPIIVILAILFILVGPVSAQEPAFMPGEILVKFEAGGRPDLQMAGVQAMEELALPNLVRMQVEPGREAELISRLAGQEGVLYATYNYRIQAQLTPDDPYFSSLWGLEQSADHDIDAPEAWDIHTGTEAVTIAFIDTGADLDHPDLVDNLWVNPGETVPNGLDDDDNGYIDDLNGWDFINNDDLPDDDNGHGSHVAGIAAAVGNNGEGVAGVSWRARVMVLKILDSAGNGTIADLAEAIFYAADKGADVINMSLGGGCDTGWPAVEEAIAYAQAGGAILVAASGNTNSNVFCPAALDGVIAVGATDSLDERWSWGSLSSNYGLTLDIAAPGENVYSLNRGGGYSYKTGTSMSTAYVSGLIALLHSYAPGLSDEQAVEIIYDSADDLGDPGWDPYFGFGRINARRALETASLQLSPPEITLLIDDLSGPVSDSVQITTADAYHLLTWTAAISPAESWLQISPAQTGTISTASSPVEVTLIATRPLTYQSYTATLWVSGIITPDVQIEPLTTEIRLHYVPELNRIYWPFIFK